MKMSYFDFTFLKQQDAHIRSLFFTKICINFCKKEDINMLIFRKKYKGISFTYRVRNTTK